MMLPDSLTRRLVIVRHLYQAGVEQSMRGEPLAGLAILTLHDAAELFLQASLEHKGAILSGKEFLGYWPALNATGVSLTRREGMKRFNQARVLLKHDGTIPAHVHIEDFRGVVGAFFEENCPTVFGMQFSEISMVGLIIDERVRLLLETAESAIAKGNNRDAMGELAIAFILAIDANIYGRGLCLDRLFHPATSSLGFFESDVDDLGRAGKAIARAIGAMRKDFGEAITVVAFNLDFDAYRYFRTVRPVVHWSAIAEPIVEWMHAKEIDTETVRRCFGFVLDAALRLEGKRRSSNP